MNRELAPSPDVPAEAYEASKDPRNWVDHYVKLELIGSGGMSTVYRAFDTQWRMEVALKFLHPHQDEELLAHGAREGRITAMLRHPAVPRVYREGAHEGQAYLAMQLIRGTTLETYRPRDERETAEIFRTLAAAVHEAHQLGIFHRDINPGNLMAEERLEPGPDGAARRVVRPYLLDFGVALVRDERLTVKGANIGKKRYMSPEQLDNRISAPSDVYALGAALYAVVTGVAPFRGIGDAALDDAVRHVDPPAPRRLNASVSRGLETIIQVAMDKDPARRYPTAAAFADALDRFIAGEDVGPRPSRARRALRRLRRHRAVAAVTALCVVALAAGAAYLRHRLAQLAESEEERWVLRYSLDADPRAEQWGAEHSDVPPAAGAGRLRLGNARRDAILRSRDEFAGDIRLEYTASVLPESPRVCDASCFLNAGEGAGDFTAGYFVGLGSESNTRAKVVRAHRIVAVNPSFRLERGRAHRIVVERDEAGVRAWVDGALVLEYWDLVPLGTEHARVGFYAHASFLELTGVRILTRGVPERTLKQRHADRLFAARDYASASRIYAELEEQAEAARERPRLRLKRAIALMQLHRDRAAGPAWEEAARILRELSAAGDASLRHPALRALVCLELAAGRPAEALRVVAENADPAQPGRRYELLRVVEERFEELCERGEPDAALALGDAVMGTMRDEALRTLGPSNLSNNLPLVWSEVLAAREEMADADRLVEELRRVAGGSLPLAGWHAERAVRRLMAAGAPGEAAARARRMLEEFDALGLRGGEAERMRIGYRGLLALAMARIDPEGAVRELESILAQPLESLNTLDAETLAQQVLIEAGRPEEALRRRPDTREALLAAGRYDRLAELDPAGGDARTHVMAHLARGERPEAWRVVAMMGSNAGEAAWRDYFVGRLEERPFRERLALWRSLPADDARFWRGLRHELHGRRAEALSCYRAVLDPPRVSRAHETYARGAVARLR